MRNRGQRRVAFTLIEMLVVIAIIAILAALLLPTLALAKAKAWKVQCMSHQRQLAAVWCMYATDNADWLVTNGLNDPPNTSKKLWVQGVFFYPEANTNKQFMIGENYALFEPYIRATGIYNCPGDRDYVKVFGQNFPKLRSYALNAYLGWAGEWDTRMSTLYKTFLKQSELTASMPSSGTFLFQDVNPNSICWPYFGVQMADARFFNFPSSLHNKGGVISFADGHVDYHRWLDRRTISPNLAYYHHHNDLSPLNPDIKWIQQRTTVKK